MQNELKNFFGENVIALFSGKKDGSMRLHGHDEWDRPIIKRREDFCKSNGVDPERFVSAQLIHGNHSEIISRPSNPKLVWHNFRMPKCDALITGDRGVYLSTTAADCFPVYFHDPVQEVCGIIHAGWKGILKGVLESTLEKAEAGLNLKPQTTKVFIGPGIRKCHFEVQKDVADQFRGFVERRVKQQPIPGMIQANEADTTRDTWETIDAWYVDLEAAIKERLIQVGVLPDNILFSNRCTYCYKAITELKALPEKSTFEYQYFSFRRDKSDPLETQMTVIGMK